mgnify:CR=1 FL=1
MKELSLVAFGNQEGEVEPWNDGYPSHAPVDAFPPNAFGFHGTPIKLVFRDRAKVRAPRRRKTRSGRAPEAARKPSRSKPAAGRRQQGRR